MDRQLYEMKADVLGIIDTEYLTDMQLKNEVTYASLNTAARNVIDKGREKSVVRGLTRTTLPKPLFIPATRG